VSVSAAAAEGVWAIVLAAGASTRFGTPKQLYQWSGRTFLQHALVHARQTVADRIVIVTGAHADKLDAVLDSGRLIRAHNVSWRDGMASSIRTGIAALPRDCAAALLMPCDQPLVDGADLQALVARWCNGPEQAVASGYAGTFGIPAVVPARLFPALRELRGDRGAKEVLRREGRQLEVFELPAGHLDIDDRIAASRLGRDDAGTRGNC
jgi:molybdenum cofactor cytidylyltransferase